ncbi:MAG: HlyD family secretion protein [Cryptosporangiaceae bacterium]|nr:HlyD family secretion protein [Cryptosporangiaceae bacterium]
MNRLGRVFAVAVLSLSAACTSGGDDGVRTGRAALGTVAEVVEAPATVSAKAVATVTAPSDGRVARLAVTDGQQVRSGQVVAVIDSPSARQRLGQARKALAAAGSGGSPGGGVTLVSSQRRSDRAAAKAFADARTAAGKIADPQLKAASLAQLSAAQTQYEAVARDARNAANALAQGIGRISAAVASVSAAQRLQAQTAYELAQSQVDALTLRAPVGGIVQLGGPSSGGSSVGDLLGSLPPDLAGQASQLSQGPSAGSAPDTNAVLTAGSQVGAGSPVATVVDVSALSITASVDETDVLLVKSGETASVDLDAVPGATYRATVTSVGVLPTTSSRGGVSYRARLTLGAGTLGDGKPAPPPRPGMSAVAKIQVREAKDVVAIPASALVRDGGRDAVWIAENGRAIRRRVTIGAQGPDTVEITQGVRAGDRIVTAGADRVKTGQKLP